MATDGILLPMEIFWSRDNDSDQEDLVHVPGVSANGKRHASKMRGRKTKEVKASIPSGQAMAHDVVSTAHQSCSKKQQNSAKLPEQKASLKDLCLDDKKRVANLIKELARVGEEKEKMIDQLQQEREQFSEKTNKMLNNHDSLIKERQVIQQHLLECQALLGRYQQLVSEQQDKISETVSEAALAMVTPHTNSKPTMAQEMLESPGSDLVTRKAELYTPVKVTDTPTIRQLYEQAKATKIQDECNKVERGEQKEAPPAVSYPQTSSSLCQCKHADTLAHRDELDANDLQQQMSVNQLQDCLHQKCSLQNHAQSSYEDHPTRLREDLPQRLSDVHPQRLQEDLPRTLREDHLQRLPEDHPGIFLPGHVECRPRGEHSMREVEVRNEPDRHGDTWLDRHRQQLYEGITSTVNTPQAMVNHSAASHPILPAAIHRPFTTAIDKLLSAEQERSLGAPIQPPVLSSTRRTDIPSTHTSDFMRHYRSLSPAERHHELLAQKEALLEEQRNLRAVLAAQEQALRRQQVVSPLNDDNVQEMQHATESAALPETHPQSRESRDVWLKRDSGDREQAVGHRLIDMQSRYQPGPQGDMLTLSMADSVSMKKQKNQRIISVKSSGRPSLRKRRPERQQQSPASAYVDESCSSILDIVESLHGEHLTAPDSPNTSRMAHDGHWSVDGDCDDNRILQEVFFLHS